MVEYSPKVLASEDRATPLYNRRCFFITFFFFLCVCVCVCVCIFLRQHVGSPLTIDEQEKAGS